MQGSFEGARGGNGKLSVLREHIGTNHWFGITVLFQHHFGRLHTTDGPLDLHDLTLIEMSCDGNEDIENCSSMFLKYLSTLHSFIHSFIQTSFSHLHLSK
jgi:hypothetical protein